VSLSALERADNARSLKTDINSLHFFQGLMMQTKLADTTIDTLRSTNDQTQSQALVTILSTADLEIVAGAGWNSWVS
jgi:hypothetical protein